MTEQTTPLLRDARRLPTTLWDLGEGQSAAAAPNDLGSQSSAGADQILYEGFCRRGSDFLRGVQGRFACVHWDERSSKLFLARDWIGERPMHWAVGPSGIAIANTISDLRRAMGSEFSYQYVRAFPQAKWQLIDLRRVHPECVSATIRFDRDGRYYDFAEEVRQERRPSAAGLPQTMASLRASLGESVTQRVRSLPSGKPALLLSGGLDSLSVALVLRAIGCDFVAYTLAIGRGGDDVEIARSYARRLGVPHKVVRVSQRDVVARARRLVPIAETYHLFNYYCSVGMWFLGQALKDDATGVAFCGEAVNEALGDYHDWVIVDPSTREKRILQHVNRARIQAPEDRALYVWGQPADKGKYNRQLGTGLAKHAGARMVKPLLDHGIDLECPYYDRDVLSKLCAVPEGVLEEAGGKPGLFLRAFRTDIEHARIPERMVLDAGKVRLQDASDGGRGGITPCLLSAGLDQPWLLKAFNREFGTTFDPERESRRLGTITA